MPQTPKNQRFQDIYYWLKEIVSAYLLAVGQTFLSFSDLQESVMCLCHSHTCRYRYDIFQYQYHSQ